MASLFGRDFLTLMAGERSCSFGNMSRGVYGVGKVKIAIVAEV